MEGTWDLVASFKVDTLPLEAMSSLKLLLPLFNAILSSSSSKELSGQEITKKGVRTLECLSASPSAFEMVTNGTPRFSSSSKWNFSISSSSDRRDEAIFF